MWRRQGVCSVMHMKGPLSKPISSTDLKLGSSAGPDSFTPGNADSCQIASHLLAVGTWHKCSMNTARTWKSAAVIHRGVMCSCLWGLVFPGALRAKLPLQSTPGSHGLCRGMVPSEHWGKGEKDKCIVRIRLIWSQIRGTKTQSCIIRLLKQESDVI